MSEKVYTIHKGINRPLVFKGLKAQYIFYAVGVVVGLFILTIVLLIAGVNSWLCIPLSMGVGALLIGRIYKMNKQFGQYGLMKRSARKAVPKALRVKSRKVFIHLNPSHANKYR